MSIMLVSLVEIFPIYATRGDSIIGRMTLAQFQLQLLDNGADKYHSYKLLYDCILYAVSTVFVVIVTLWKEGRLCFYPCLFVCFFTSLLRSNSYEEILLRGVKRGPRTN